MSNYSYNSILSRLKSSLTNLASKIEGSFAMDNIQAVSKEFAKYYSYLEYLSNRSFLDTATGEFLDRKALDYGVDRKLAEPAIGVVTFSGITGTTIPFGFLVASSSATFRVTVSGEINADGFVDLPVECLVPGIIGNVSGGSVTTIVESKPGLVSVINASSFASGIEQELDDDFRGRIYARIRQPSASGNKYDYVNWALECAGVSKARCFPLWNGAGTVKVSVLGPGGSIADQALVDEVKDYIDPTTTQGQGDGKAPIGAIVTITTASTVNISVSANITYEAYMNTPTTKAAIKSNISDHLKSIAYDGVTSAVSYAQIGYIILSTTGVSDYNALTINLGTSNVAIGSEQIPSLQEVKLDGAII